MFNTNFMGGISNLSLLSNAKTRSISPENMNGAVGGGARCELEDGNAYRAARDLGKGWKVNPYIYLQPGETRTVTIAVPEDSLRQFDYAMKEVLLPGKIEWFLCDSGETKLEGNFVI